MVATRPDTTCSVVRSQLDKHIGGFALFGLGVREFYPALALTLCLFVIATIAWEFYRALGARRRLPGERALQALVTLFRRNQRRYGGFVVHLGVVLLIMGIAVSMSYSIEKELTLRQGEVLEVGRYSARFLGLVPSRQPTHTRVEGRFEVFDGDRRLGIMRPALKYFPGQQAPVGRAVFRSTLREDLYLILSGFMQDDLNSVTVRALVRPMVAWLWIGGAVMALGTLLCVFPFPRPRPAEFPTPEAALVKVE